jgi:homoserine/homoserine lactone efflux protein
MEIELWLTFATASLLIAISPGSGAVNAMSNGLQYGVKQTIPAILGLQLGYAIQVAIVGIGLGALLVSSTLAFEVIKWLGVCYLVWLGYKKFIQAPMSLEFSAPHKECAKQKFWTSAFVNLTNPKATIFLLALFPQFVDPTAVDNVTQYMVMGATLITVDFIVMSGYACLAAQLTFVMKNENSQIIQNRIFGGMYIGIATLMASYQNS